MKEKVIEHESKLGAGDKGHIDLNLTSSLGPGISPGANVGFPEQLKGTVGREAESSWRLTLALVWLSLVRL